jgi:hypothetical protein
VRKLSCLDKYLRDHIIGKEKIVKGEAGSEYRFRFDKKVEREGDQRDYRDVEYFVAICKECDCEVYKKRLKEVTLENFGTEFERIEKQMKKHAEQHEKPKRILEVIK